MASDYNAGFAAGIEAAAKCCDDISTQADVDFKLITSCWYRDGDEEPSAYKRRFMAEAADAIRALRPAAPQVGDAEILALIETLPIAAVFAALKVLTAAPSAHRAGDDESWYCDNCAVEVYERRCPHCGKTKREKA